MPAIALVVAAGRGERLGLGAAKALVPLAGRPMLEWSILALRSVEEISEIVVALPAGVAAPEGCVAAAGGAVRSASVRNALAAAGPGDHVLVHDAARPLIEPALIRRTLDAIAEAGVDAVVAAAPVTDTIKEAGTDGVVTRTLDRGRLWAVQTPQVFRRGALERALEMPADVVEAATDEASLVERGGGCVRIVEAPHSNLKVTTPLDLRVAAGLLAERGDAPD